MSEMLITFDKIYLVLTYNAESPTARRWAGTLSIVETCHGASLHLRDADAPIATPERPNKKKKNCQTSRHFVGKKRTNCQRK